LLLVLVRFILIFLPGCTCPASAGLSFFPSRKRAQHVRFLAQLPSSFLRGFGIGKLNSIKTLGDPLVDGLTELFFRSETVRVLGGQRSTPPGTTIAAYMTSRPAFGWRWPARLVATAAAQPQS
jgi:hypothetical protein